jgi:hypothetical protein
MSHRCPRRTCQVQVSNALFCCPVDWSALSRNTQKAIYRTVGMGTLSLPRREAIHTALEEWRAIDATTLAH